MRAIFVPFGGNKFVREWWLKHAEQWLPHTGAVLFSDTSEGQHGDKMAKFVKEYPAEYMMFIEEDGIVLDPTFISRCFKLLEDGHYDLIGSPRMSCSPEIADAAATKWRLDYTGLGDKGPNFWPNFLFVKRTDLLKTDLHFTPKGWQVGQKIYVLDHTVKEPEVRGDTFVWASLQLRGMGLRIKEIPQYHSSPYDLEHLQCGEGVFDGNAPWFHLGSLAGDFTPPQSDMEKLEMEKRVMWRELCGENMTNIIRKYKLDNIRIALWKQAYTNLLREHGYDI